MRRFEGITSKLLILGIMTFTITTPMYASTQQIDLNDNNKEIEVSIKQKTPVISYKNTSNEFSTVVINNKDVVKYTSAAGGFTPEQRAKILVSRLNDFISNKLDPKEIKPGFEGNIAVVRAEKEILFTVDHKNAEVEGLTPAKLALEYANNIREALNAPKIIRNSNLVASRGGISPTVARTTKLQEGMASWYGGYFHGRKAADGSTFNKHEFTAAHKHLPFGTMVKVINKNNGKSCIVKITDRGPFIPGRVIDLSRAAASSIGMLSSGVAPVVIEKIQR